jgi:positive phototaxis protein PixI
MKAHTTLTRLQQLLPELFNPVEVTGDPYLRFQLTPEIPALLSMEMVQEALLIPANSISPLPNMPDFLIGMVNARDRVFCVVDLAQLLGVAAPLMNQREYQVIVVNLSTPASSVTDNSSGMGKLLGLAVSRVRGIARLAVAPAPSIDGEFPAILTPFLKGCLLVSDERLVVLDAKAIVTNKLLLDNSNN